MMSNSSPLSATRPLDRWASARRLHRRGWTIGLALSLSGCTTRAAPTLILFGAYFPTWIFCAVAGVFGAVFARVAMVALNLSSVLPYQLFICVAVGLIVAVALWLFWFGR